jgi:hypothetical protein
VVEVPVAVGRVLASAESNMTAAQVNTAGQVFSSTSTYASPTPTRATQP